MNLLKRFFNKPKQTNVSKLEPEPEYKYVGETTHCVNCGNEVGRTLGVTCGHLIKSKKEKVLARFCNGICLRDIHFKIPYWNGMEWIDEYGVRPFDEVNEEVVS